mmetsp:Transcript_17530/g.27305  ORF Transcript_17530/g.27305 Transcript_17530/m.27305 type:complete len:89 (-) Transcript_17530:1597-1863(-)
MQTTTLPAVDLATELGEKEDELAHQGPVERSNPKARKIYVNYPLHYHHCRMQSPMIMICRASRNGLTRHSKEPRCIECMLFQFIVTEI